MTLSWLKRSQSYTNIYYSFIHYFFYFLILAKRFTCTYAVRDLLGLSFFIECFLWLHDYIHHTQVAIYIYFRQAYGLAPRIAYVVCVYFIHDWRDIQFKITSERQIFRKIFHVNIFYYFLRTNYWGQSRGKYFLIFLFVEDI